MDREARDPFELCEEIEKELGIDTYAVNWPIGCGKDFKGVYDRNKREIIHFTSNGGARQATAVEVGLDDPELDGLIGPAFRTQLQDDIELLDGASCDFDMERVRHGKLSPVFFGSALTNFGVEPFLEDFLRMTTPPLPRQAGEVIVDSMDDEFSAFVFKIQANMNKAHRDRIAFMRVVSGRFDADREVYHVQGGKKIKLSRPSSSWPPSGRSLRRPTPETSSASLTPGSFPSATRCARRGRSSASTPSPPLRLSTSGGSDLWTP